MNDKEFGEKERERVRLDLFLEAYEFTVGQQLRELFYFLTERPDFICTRPGDTLVGVELTRVMKRPDLAFELQVIGENSALGIWETVEKIHYAIATKEEKRSDPDWKLAEDTILVLEVMNTPSKTLSLFLTKSDLQDEFKDHGFCEIWIANYTTVEAHTTVELFGLYPEEWWGPYERWNACQKPYG